MWSAAVTDKMIRRHPHVFGGAEAARCAHGQKLAWEALKAAERAQKATKPRPGLVLDDVPLALPALLRAEKLQRRASSVGFDWDDAGKVVEKIAEEAREVAEAGPDQAEREEEIGDLLFVVANLARHLKVDPEAALRGRQRQIHPPLQLYRAGTGSARPHTPKAPAWMKWKRCGRKAKRKRL